MRMTERRLVTSATLGLGSILLALGVGFARAAGGTALLIVLPVAAGLAGLYLAFDYLRGTENKARRTAYTAVAANLLGVLLAVGLVAPLLLAE